MSSIDISVPHNLTRDEALTRVKQLSARLQEEKKDMISSITESWDGYTGSYDIQVKGFSIAPRISVEDNRLQITGTLPFALSFFKEMISKMIEAEASKLLA